MIARDLVDNQLIPLLLIVLQMVTWHTNPTLCIIASWIVLFVLQVIFTKCTHSATLGISVMFGYSYLILGASITFGYLTNNLWVILLTIMPVATYFLNISTLYTGLKLLEKKVDV